MVAFTLVLVVCGKADAQKVDAPSPTSQQHILSLNFTNNGQHLVASVGQQIEITLGTVGGPQYGKPEVSSAAIRLECVALGVPVTPGGPTFIYIFEAAAEGQAQVKVPIINSHNPDWTKEHTFAATIHVGPASGNPRKPHAFLTPDQSNTEPWNGAWTNLSNAQQSFKPSLPRLTGVEVELVVANSGPASGEVTLALMNAEGENLADVSKTVTVADCNHVLFLLPKGGAQVLPGQIYSIALNGDRGVFGWKYVKDGYANGAALMNSKPLSGESPATFLFRTFGAN
jgi:archaellum component FlaF (FlaF/FlaG flagellin family)